VLRPAQCSCPSQSPCARPAHQHTDHAQDRLSCPTVRCCRTTFVMAPAGTTHASVKLRRMRSRQWWRSTRHMQVVAEPPVCTCAHLSSSSPPVTSSVTMYTFRPVMYTAYSLMQFGWSTCMNGDGIGCRCVAACTAACLEADRGACAAGKLTLHSTWISLSKLLSPAAYRDLSTTCVCGHPNSTACVAAPALKFPSLSGWVRVDGRAP
jgi:hypothetical protein